MYRQPSAQVYGITLHRNTCMTFMTFPFEQNAIQRTRRHTWKYMHLGRLADPVHISGKVLLVLSNHTCNWACLQQDAVGRTQFSDILPYLQPLPHIHIIPLHPYTLPHSHPPTLTSSHTHILPPLHPPTLTSSQSRGLQLNVIPLALRWYSSSGGSTRITSNFDPREERSKVLRSHLRYIGCVAPLAIDSSYSEKHRVKQCSNVNKLIVRKNMYHNCQ